jgi:hypothetical protein
MNEASAACAASLLDDTLPNHFVQVITGTPRQATNQPNDCAKGPATVLEVRASAPRSLITCWWAAAKLP